MSASSAREHPTLFLNRGLLCDHVPRIHHAYVPTGDTRLHCASFRCQRLADRRGSDSRRDQTKVPAPASAPSNAAPKPAAAGSATDGDAPARHARRTVCLKNAKAKKLVGAQRTSYVKDCMGGP